LQGEPVRQFYLYNNNPIDYKDCIFVLTKYNYMTLRILLIIPIAALFSCTNQTETKVDGINKALTAKNVIHQIKTTSDTTYIDVKGNSYKFLAGIPDSLQTKEQSQLIKLINENTYKYMSVKNNHMVYELTKEQYIAKGIPSRYYDLTQKSIKDNNVFFDANGINNVDSMVRETKKELGLSQ
jgi:hypothetical protein